MPLSNIAIDYAFPLTIFFAYLLDLILGDPEWLPHPIRWIGRYISFLEDKIRIFADTPLSEKICGTFLFIIVVGTVFGLAWVLLYFSFLVSHFLFIILSVFIAYVSLSIKLLKDEALSVTSALENISMMEARKRLKNIVGRDTANLSKDEIYRAVTETVSENTSDGIIAPLFYLALGGPALALAYKAINTLDSMVGYKNQKYKNLGWFSARMDDIANFTPSRITAILMVFASFILRFNWRDSLKIIWKDARKHPSPNAGFPEAAVAGALGLQLGGTNYYFGMPHHRPLIGDEKTGFTSESVNNTLKIMQLTAFSFVCMLLIISITIYS